VSALDTVRAASGLAAYLDRVEEQLAAVVEAHPGTVAAVGADALSAGGKRLRPTLTFLSHDAGSDAPVAEGVAVELVHMATLVHDDIVDGARLRRGRAAAWTAHGGLAAKATGDHLFAAAFATLAATGSPERLASLADASLALARGEALQRLQRRDAATTVEAYLERCSLKTGSLFAAACALGGGNPEFGRLLGVAFQIVDDVLDCTGETAETGKVPGTDLRDGTPTLPLLLAAQQDEVVRRALEGGPLEGALVRVAATDALSRSRALAVDYARRARASLDGVVRREELEALVDAVVDRDR
jgi:geranylgeranyl pyrophosphate synthase